MLHRIILGVFVAVVLAGCTVAHGGGGRNSWTMPGELRWTEGQDLDNLNPILTNEAAVTDLSVFTQAYLFLFGAHGELVPSLAVTEPSRENRLLSADGKTIIYRLRRGVLWHDGVPFTSADVAFSVKTILDPRVNAASTQGFSDIARLDTPDPYTVIVRLRQPYSPFVSTFMTPHVGSAILPKHLLEGKDINHASYNGLPIGAGPFKYVRWQRGGNVVLEAFTHYWGRAPKLRKITYNIVTDSSAAISELESHELDAFARVPNEQYRFAAGVTGTRTIDFDTYGFEHIVFNLMNPILRDLRVRQALAHAVDTPMIREKVNHGSGFLQCSPIPHFSWAYNAQTPCYAFDRRTSGTLLDQAGWRLSPDGLRRKNGEPLRLTLVSTTGNQTRDQSAVLIQSSLHQIGVDLSYRRYQANQLFAKRDGILDSGKFDLSLFTWFWLPDPDISDLYECSRAAPIGENEGRYCNPQVDRLLQDALTHYDRATRRADYLKAQEIIGRDVPTITLYQRVDHLTVNSDMRNAQPGPSQIFWNAAAISN